MLALLLSSLVIVGKPFLITKSPPLGFEDVAIEGVATDDVARVGGLEIS